MSPVLISVDKNVVIRGAEPKEKLCKTVSEAAFVDDLIESVICRAASSTHFHQVHTPNDTDTNECYNCSDFHRFNGFIHKYVYIICLKIRELRTTILDSKYRVKGIFRWVIAKPRISTTLNGNKILRISNKRELCSSTQMQIRLFPKTRIFTHAAISTAPSCLGSVGNARILLPTNNEFSISFLQHSSDRSLLDDLGPVEGMKRVKRTRTRARVDDRQH